MKWFVVVPWASDIFDAIHVSVFGPHRTHKAAKEQLKRFGVSGAIFKADTNDPDEAALEYQQMMRRMKSERY